MVTKKTNNQPSSNFRQQESTARKLESNFDTAAQKQFSQTATVIEGTGNQQKPTEKLQKQHTNQTTHSVSEFRQPEITASKIEKPLETSVNQQLSQTSSVLNSNENNSSFANSDSNSKLQKKFSDQVREEFRQPENTASKIEKTLETSVNQQLSQTSSVLNSNENNSSFVNSDSNSKLQKKFSDQVREEFRQPENTASKIEKTLETSVNQQLSQTSSVLNSNENNSSFANSDSNSKLQKKFSDQVREEFRQPENTASKLEKTLETGVQQLSRSSSVLEKSNGNNDSLTNSDPNKSKLQKKLSNQVREEFRQPENTANKLEKTLETSVQQQLSRTSSVLIDNSSEKNGSLTNSDPNKSKLQKKLSNQLRKESDNKLDKVLQPKEQQRFEKINNQDKLKDKIDSIDNLQKTNKKFKLTKKLAKGSVATVNDKVKSGLKKYQRELEKDDEGVKFASQSATQAVKTAKFTKKLSKKASNKLREKRLERKIAKENPENPLYKKKPIKTTLKKIAKVPVTVVKTGVKTGVKGAKKGAVSYQKALEQDDEAVKLTSQSATQVARTTKKLAKGVGKLKESKKLQKQGTKLKQSQLNRKKVIKAESKAVLQKKAIKKKLYYAPKSKKNRFAGAMTSFSNRMSNVVKSIATFNRTVVTKMLGAKVAAALGGGLAAVLPLILLVGFVLILVAVMGGSSEEFKQPIVGSKNLSPEVEQWRPLVETEAAAQGMEKYVNLILAIIQVESGGTGTRDIMQSSESAGYPRNYWSTEEESVRQGIKYLKSIVNMVSPFGLENDYKLLAQAYNFGSPFAAYVGNLGGIFNLDVAEQYSREVVAPSLGNHSGETYSYINATSQRLGKTYLYRNGGNFMYHELVAEYLGGSAVGVSGDFAIVLAELEKYIGWEYVWGGKSPSTGFDCSGFVSWGLKQIGIELDSYAASQYDSTVPIDPSEAQPGDLIFFKGTYGGPNHISHVGFYIDENTMLDSNNSGIGYHSWKDPYWQRHFAGIRRVVK